MQIKVELRLHLRKDNDIKCMLTECGHLKKNKVRMSDNSAKF